MNLRSTSSRRMAAILLPTDSPFHNRDITRGLVLATLVGVIAGLGAVFFRNLIEWIEILGFEKGKTAFSALGDYYIVLIPAIGGLFVGPLIYFFAREAKGHGVPEVMIAVSKNGGRIRPRVALVKILASAITIGTGGSVGREGPIVQIGATLGSAIGQRLRLPENWIRTLVACGAAGGVSATFNAPIAGVFFALEVILGNFTTRYFSVVVVSSVVAAVVSHAFFPDIANLVVPEYGLESAWEIPLYGILGILAGAVGVIFMVVLYFFEDSFDRLKLIPEWFRPVIGGLCVGALGLYSTDLFGVGYGALERAANGEMLFQTALILLGLKILATSITIGSGGSGGVFAPSLFLGAMLGAAFGFLANQLFPGVAGPVGAYAIVGMASVFSSTARAPITAVVILFELTRDYQIILPLMLCVVLSTVVSQLLHRESIYTKKIRRKGIEPPGEEMLDSLENVIVGDVMTKDFQNVPASLPLGELEERFKSAGQRGLLGMDEANEMLGIVTVSDLESALREGRDTATAGDIATRSVVTAYPDQSLRSALLQIGAEQVGRIPVVTRENKRVVAGVLRRHDIIGAYIRSAGKSGKG